MMMRRRRLVTAKKISTLLPRWLQIEQVHAQQEMDTQMAHELASDAERMFRFEAPRTHDISHFPSPGLSCFERGPSTRPPTRADLDLASSGGAGSFARKVSHNSLAHPQVRPHLPVYDYESDSGPPPLEYSSNEEDGSDDYDYYPSDDDDFGDPSPPKRNSSQSKTDFSLGGVVGATSGGYKQSQPTIGVGDSSNEVLPLEHGALVCKLSRTVSCFMPTEPKAGGNHAQGVPSPFLLNYVLLASTSTVTMANSLSCFTDKKWR
jgi:hypothetical protein